MKILVISPKNKTVFNFRGDLIRDMIAAGHEVYVTGPNRDFIDDVLALGVKEFIEVPFVKDNTHISGDLSYLSQLKNVMRRLQPDLVFSYTIKPVVYGSMAAKSVGVPHVYAMVTGLGRVYASASLKTKGLRMITKALYRRAFKGCDKVIFQNRDDREEFVKGGYLPADKTAVVNGSGVNMERFQRTPLPESPVFLMVSRIIKEKGVLEYAEAARLLKKQVPQARCILLGGFDNSIGALKSEDIQEYLDDGSLELPGEVKDPVSFYAGCTVFVLPSYYREGLPRTILEGMSCGRPVITTDWVGCREPIEDGKNGFLVPIKDAATLADRMIRLATDRALLEQMADAAYDRCKTAYAVDVVNAQMREILQY
ncbi:MAG: glycosyltransferase family 4 protein [Clostridia bacterium]|nr:glycosyltransferase family 4 protein [Clostridia bacterium]